MDVVDTEKALYFIGLLAQILQVVFIVEDETLIEELEGFKKSGYVDNELREQAFEFI